MEKVIADWKKSTAHKEIWSVNLGGVDFNLYIPKWRIPKPIPEKILIKIYFSSEEVRDEKFISMTDIQLHPELIRNKIYSHVHKVSEKTKTIRFEPNGNSNDWEIGSPYIPYSILKDHDFDELIIVIEWLDLNNLRQHRSTTVDDKLREVSKLIEYYETKLRNFIEEQLKIHYNKDWWEKGIPENIKSVVTQKIETEMREEPKREYKNIDFCDLGDYKLIIFRKKNSQVFSKFFHNKNIQYAFDRLTNLRNAIRHVRYHEDDLDKCKTYILDVLKFLPEQ